MTSLFDFQYSPWFIFLCILMGGLYAYIQYQRQSPWPGRTNLILAIVRGVLVSVIAVMLLGPTLRIIRNYYEKPLMVIAIDNSESLAMASTPDELAVLKSSVKEIEQSLRNNGWDVNTVDINGNTMALDSIQFANPRTDLTGMVKSVQVQNSGKNLGGILVVSDGIFNTGFSPDFISTYSPIYGIGVGDTIPRKDLSIIDVKHNKTVYQDNQFPVIVAIRNEGMGPATRQLSIYRGDALLAKTTLNILPDERLLEHRFLIPADKPGKQRLTVRLQPLPGEQTEVNNHRSFYIEVIDGQQKVLIVGNAPAPDMKALRLAISAKEHFQVEVNVDGELTNLDYDLIIINQLPDRKGGTALYQQLMKADVPKLFIIGSSTNIPLLNRDGIIGLNVVAGQFDQVTGVINPAFNGFVINENMSEWLAGVPPVAVPYGKLQLPVNARVLLYQRVGSLATEKPLVYLVDSDPKLGVILGEGLWRWRLNEYQSFNETTRFDELITKISMFLAAKPDNRQFKMYPEKESYEFGESIRFVAETYNELFEPVFGEPVNLQIRKKDFLRSYSFTPLAGSRELKVEELPEGIYNFTASTRLNGKPHKVSGQFSVEIPDLEAADLTADFTVLRKLAAESKGKFYTLAEIETAKNDFSAMESTSIIHSHEKEMLVLNVPWILILLLTLATGEWLTRKMMGGY